MGLEWRHFLVLCRISIKEDMKKIFFNLSFVLVVLVGWVIYDNWDKIAHVSVPSIDHIVPKNLISSNKEQTTITKIYKWKDADGNWHFTNEAPEGVTNAEVQTIRSNNNVIPSTLPSSASHAEQKPNANKNSNGLFSRLPNAINEARNLDHKIDERNKRMEKITSDL